MSSYKQQGLKARVLKVSMPGSGRAQRIWGCSWRKDWPNGLWTFSVETLYEELAHVMRRLVDHYGAHPAEVPGFPPPEDWT